jgi:hypothetical protein
VSDDDDSFISDDGGEVDQQVRKELDEAIQGIRGARISLQDNTLVNWGKKRPRNETKRTQELKLTAQDIFQPNFLTYLQSVKIYQQTIADKDNKIKELEEKIERIKMMF